MSNSFAGIKPSCAPAFIAAQIVGALGATALARFLHPDLSPEDVVVPHDPSEADRH
jgi:hypothetical protein